MKSRSKVALPGVLAPALLGLLLASGCAGTATAPSASSSPVASVTSPVASATPSAAVSPSSSAPISSALQAQAVRLVETVFALVQSKHYAQAQALMTAPDKVWALSDMKRITRIRLISSQVDPSSTPQLIVLLTVVQRSPQTVTGSSDWPSVVKIAVDPATAKLSIVAFDTGP
ncbi:MAG: hypothetical protein ACLQUT_06400 [Thermoleophilia bacterium]